MKKRLSSLPPAALEPLIAPLAWAPGSLACPVCREVHIAPCSKFWAAYKAYNEDLRERLRKIATPLPPRPPTCRDKHPFEAVCSDCGWRKRGAA